MIWMEELMFFNFDMELSLVKCILQENCSKEVQKRILASFKLMSASFTDSSKAEEHFQSLNEMKDNNIFKALGEMIDENTSLATSQSIRVNYIVPSFLNYVLLSW